ncbi:hypothetical protein ACFOY2_14515 [Nonomuraea purpurea]|uniref:Uncharacterized protein n=1 Tax=Nonomuraea purpurea TaxID=1849276 RepID=A0ABV8G5Q8_9ACTN
MQTRWMGAVLIVVAVGVSIVTLSTMRASWSGAGTFLITAAALLIGFGLAMLVAPKPSPAKQRYDEFMRSAE